MKIGSAITFLLLALIALGFLLSDNINTHGDLVNIERQLEQTIKEKDAVQGQLETAVATITELNQQVEALTLQVIALQDEMHRIQNVNQLLQEQNTQLQQTISQQVALISLKKFLADTPVSMLSLAMILPVVPASMAAFSVVNHRKQKPHDETVNRQKTKQRTIWAQLTEEEMKHLIKIRRGRQ